MDHGYSQRTITTLPLLPKLPELPQVVSPIPSTAEMSHVAVGQKAPDFTATAVMDGRLKGKFTPRVDFSEMFSNNYQNCPSALMWMPVIGRALSSSPVPGPIYAQQRSEPSLLA